MGNDLWKGLALIVVVLTGLKIAFSGNIQPWELVKLVIGLWIPWVMLQFYTTNIPGMAFTFPGMIAAGGNWLHDLLIGDTIYAMHTELANLFKNPLGTLSSQLEHRRYLGVTQNRAMGSNRGASAGPSCGWL